MKGRIILTAFFLLSHLYAQSAEDKGTAETIQSKIDSLQQVRVSLQNEIDRLRQVRISLQRRIQKVDTLLSMWEIRRVEVEAEEFTSDRIVLRTKTSGSRLPSLRQSPDPLARYYLNVIPPDTKVVGLDFMNDYWKVDFKGTIGFVSDIFIVPTDDTKRFAQTASLRHKRIEANKVWVKALKANLRQAPSTGSEILTTLEQGDLLYVQARNNQWLRVMFYNLNKISNRYGSYLDFENIYNEGWVHESLLSKDKVLKLSSVQRRRQEFVEKNTTISETFKKAILHGQIMLGMTKEMVIASWGEPYDINRTVGSFGVNEQWIYGSEIEYSKYLYFENGILTSWQD